MRVGGPLCESSGYSTTMGTVYAAFTAVSSPALALLCEVRLLDTDIM